MPKEKKIEKNLVPEITGNIFEKTVEEVMHTSMMPYSEYVILDRALPRVEDGLKPVQRRILYTMLELGITPDKPYRKSARIVGDCLGKFHPHGDRSIYDAMVRMAQPFNMSNILVKGHGNFGSIDGDGAAAMRYTEVKLSELALELMRDLDKETVSYSLNFDDTMKEPDYFTGRYPNLLVNGASGIAVGLATNIPPHNLNEVIDAVVEYIDNKNCTLNDLLKHVKGPDFPSGGIMQKTEEMLDAYKTGKGKVIIRSKFHTEILPNGKINIVITELPFQVNKAEFLQKILVVKDKFKGELNNIVDINDESDKSGMRAVITLKKDSNTEEVIALLLKHTDMQIAYNINTVAIANGKPMLLGLMEIMKYYVEFQIDVICKRTRYDLEKAKARAHIVEGLIIAIQNIDEVIKIIKASSSTMQAKENLKARFNLSEMQAVAILDMKLSRLTNLETTKLIEELEELRKLIDEYTKILASRARQLGVVKKEILDIKKRFDTARRTQVVKSFDSYDLAENNADKLPSECLVAVTYDGLRLKNIDTSSLNGGDNSFSSYNSLNVVHKDNLRINGNATLLVFTDLGNVYKMKTSDIPLCKFNNKGTPLNTLVKSELDEKIVNLFEFSEVEGKDELYFFTEQGFIKKCEINEYKISKNIALALKLKENDKVIKVQNNYMCPSSVMVTEQGMAVNFTTQDVPCQKRNSSGVIGMSLNKDDKVIFASQVSHNDKMLIVSTNSNAKRMNLSELPITARNRKGLKILPKDKILFVASPIITGEIVIENSKGISSIDVNKIEVCSRTASGKPIIKSKTENKIKYCGVYLY